MDESENTPEEQEQPQELSLEQLSQAYAQVLKEQGAEADVDASVDEEPLEEDAPESVESAPRRVQKTLEQLDNEDNESCPISPKSIVESILFVGAPEGSNLTARKIAAVMRDVSPKEVKQVIKELNNDYERDNSPLRIVEEDKNYMLRLTPDTDELQNHFFGRNRPAKLSQSAIDVLAVVAYNQPVTRAKVDKIRSRPSGGVLGQLLRRELIATIEGKTRKDNQYETTDRFLDLFGLESLKDLPQTSAASDLQELADY